MSITYIFNPFTGNLDAVNTSAPSSGNVTNTTGIGTNDAIAIFDVDGTHIKNSVTKVQDSGAIEAQGFLTRRSITALVSIPNGESWIAPSLELELTGSIELEPNGEIIIV